MGVEGGFIGLAGVRRATVAHSVKNMQEETSR